MPTLSTILEEKEVNPPFTYAISNRSLFPGVSAQNYLQALFQAPAQMIQWREKDLSRNENRPFVRAGVKLSKKSGKIFLLNSDFELGLQERTDGAHLTSQQNLETATRMREAFGIGRFLLGKSAHSISGVLDAEKQGADYVLLAPIFDPISKASHTSALGLEVLQEAAETVSIPVVALGGVSEENAYLAFEAGAFAVAGISWVYPHVLRTLSES